MSSNASPPNSTRDLLLEADCEDSPGMAQSSASDSSSNSEDVAEEKVECEEWAASIIAGLTEHQRSPIKIRPSRSASVSSDDASNDSNESPPGFWRTAPGSTPAAGLDVDVDDDSIEWSPGSSPRDSVNMFYMVNPPTMLDVPHSGKENKSDPKTPTVTFSETTQSFSPPSTVNYKTPPALNDDTEFLAAPISGINGMARSKSYTALSATTGRAKKTVGSSLGPSSVTMSEDYDDNYRKYFHKFIDLVIVRETTAALHHSRHGADHKF